MNMENTTAINRVKQLAAVSFVGADAASFLQGQLTANTQTLLPGRWRRAAYCSRQGRVLVCGLICRLPHDDADHFLFIVAADTAADMTTQLRRFILRAKVRTETVAAVFTAGNVSTTPPAAEGDLIAVDGAWRVDENGEQGLHVYLGDTAEAAASAVVTGDDDDAWGRAEILRGVPWVNSQTQGLFIPQFINFELLGGVDFEKGCYVGQEIIARLHHLGKVKYRGMIICGNGPPPQAAAALMNGDDKKAGEVVNAIGDGDGGFVALASINTSLAMTNGGGLQCNNSVVQLRRPPYPLP